MLGLPGPHRSNRWNKPNHSCRQISSKTSVMPHRGCLGVMIDIHFGYLCANTQTHSGATCGHCGGDRIASQPFLIAR
ncbi:hypothetical protein ACTXT7_010017 [Hymenolepis weldensis]